MSFSLHRKGIISGNWPSKPGGIIEIRPSFKTPRPKQNGRQHFSDISIFLYENLLTVFGFKFNWNLFPMVKLTISQYWFRYWLGAEKATSHYLNQWCPSCLTHIHVTNKHHYGVLTSLKTRWVNIWKLSGAQQRVDNFSGGWCQWYTGGPGLLSKIHVQLHFIWQGFSNMASDELVAVLPANHMPCLKWFVNEHGFQLGNFLVIQAPGVLNADTWLQCSFIKKNDYFQSVCDIFDHKWFDR